MWDTTNVNGNWSCGVGAKTDLTGTGVRAPSEDANPWWISVGSRATGFPLIAGLIRVEEVRAGAIDHALVFAYPYCRSEVYVPPVGNKRVISRVFDFFLREVPIRTRKMDVCLMPMEFPLVEGFFSILRLISNLLLFRRLER